MLGTFFKSLPPAIVGFIRTGFPLIVSNLVSLLNNMATKLLSVANNMSGSVISEWLTANIPKIMQSGAKLIGQLATAFIKNLPKIVSAIARIGLAIVTGLGSAIWGKVTAAANGIKNRFLAPINSLKEKVRSIIDKIKGFFSFSVSAPHIPLPHFAISPAGWKLGDLLKGVKPSLSISWYAKGGIVDGATLIGAGEKGAEAIVPLDPFWKRLDKMAEATNTPVVINVYASNGMDVNELAYAVEKRIVQMQKRRTAAWV